MGKVIRGRREIKAEVAVRQENSAPYWINSFCMSCAAKAYSLPWKINNYEMISTRAFPFLFFLKVGYIYIQDSR